MPRRRVLLVDDDVITARMYALGLETAGYEVTAVLSASAALEAAAKQTPDIAILDWELPGINGDELYEVLRGSDLTRHLPLMFLSNHRRSQSRIVGVVIGGTSIPWLVKVDTTPAQLCERIAEVLGSRQTRPTSPAKA